MAASRFTADPRPGLVVLAPQLDRLTLHDTGTGAVSGIDADLRGGSALVAIDAGDDGDADLVAASRWRRELLFYENSGSGSFANRVVLTQGIDSAIALLAVRVDADEREDLVVATDYDGRLFWLRGQGASFDPVPRVIAQSAQPGVALAAADIDRDGDADLVLARARSVHTCLNDGNGVFVQVAVLPFAAAQVQLADGDGDALPDLLLRLEPSGEVHFLRGRGDGTWHPPVRTPLAGGHFAAADLDGDGDIDLLAASRDGGAMFWCENRGGASFGPPQHAGAARATVFLLGDDDLDGDPDLFAADHAAANLVRATGLGRQPYERWAAGFQPLVIGGPFDDADGDGRPNLLAYAFNYHPAAPAPALLPGSGHGGLPVVTRLADGAAFEFVRLRATASGLVYQVETSSDLESWVPAGTEEPDIEPINDDWERVRLRIDEPPRPSSFARVKLTYSDL